MKVLAWPKQKNRAHNPYNFLLYQAIEKENVIVDEFSLKRALKGRYDVIHIHWPEAFFIRPSFLKSFIDGSIFLMLCALMKIRGMKLVWTAHNIGGHEKRHVLMQKIFNSLFRSMVDLVLYLSEASKQALCNKFEKMEAVPYAITPHGDYIGIYPDVTDKKPNLRDQLLIPKHSSVIVFLGQIRAYKNVLELINVFNELDDAEAFLIIAGNCNDGSLKEELLLASKSNKNIILHFGFVDDDDVARYLSVATVAVLPYREILNSGSCLLALSMGCPVLSPHMGSLAEVSNIVGKHNHRTYIGKLTPVELRQSLEAFTGMRVDKADLAFFSWKSVAEMTVNAYKLVTG
jgi:glycosyltransferase involved in cell wall biosynthesis